MRKMLLCLPLLALGACTSIDGNPLTDCHSALQLEQNASVAAVLARNAYAAHPSKETLQAKSVAMDLYTTSKAHADYICPPIQPL